MDRIERGQQFQRRANAGRRSILRLDLRGADDVNTIRLGGDVDRVTRVQQTNRARQRKLRRVNTHHLAAHSAHRRQVRLRAQPPTIDDPVRPHLRRLNLGMPAQADASINQRPTQRGQQGAIVELAFPRQIDSLGETLAQGRFHLGNLRAGELPRATVNWQLVIVSMESPAELRGLITILCMPDDQSTALLEKNRIGQGRQQLRPALQASLPQTDDQRFGLHGFGQRRQHRRRHMGRRLAGVRAAPIIEFDTVPFTRE